MGSLGDGIGGQGRATGTEMRTAPLWGARFRTRFLHDGRATSVDAAIRAHAGQAQAARDRYVNLSDSAARDGSRDHQRAVDTRNRACAAPSPGS